MKKLLAIFLVLIINSDAQDILVGAVPVPHAEILEVTKPLLEKEGYTLEIKEIDDKILNYSLDSGDIDANFYQHEPYLNEFNKANKTNLVSIAKVHLEPMAIYSTKFKSIDEITKNSKVSIPNDPVNESRALLLLQSAGLLELITNENPTLLDISKNPKNLEIVTLAAATLPRSINDVGLSIISTSYALAGGLNPLKDGIFIEKSDSPYVNIIAINYKDLDDPKFEALSKAIRSDEVKSFINQKYKGAVLPAF